MNIKDELKSIKVIEVENIEPLPFSIDNNTVYIKSFMRPSEKETLIKTAKLKIILKHDQRFERVEKTSDKKSDDLRWALSCAFETAKNFYTEKDIDAINKQKSNISFLQVISSAVYAPPELEIAEEFYDFLLKEEQQAQHSKQNQGSELTQEEREQIKEHVKNVSESIKKEIEEQEAAKAENQEAQELVKHAKSRPPSLFIEIDATARHRLTRERSYRRPSRREECDFIQKGRITQLRRPKIEVYVDRSASFTPEKTADAQNTIKKIAKRYGASIRCDFFYFCDNIVTQKDPLSGGSTPHHLVINQISANKPELAIIVTDDDDCQLQTLPEKTQRIVIFKIGCDKTRLHQSLISKGLNSVEVER